MNEREAREIDKVDIGTRVVELVDSLGRIDLDNLHDEMEQTGALSLWFGDFAARAKRRASDFELIKDVTWAQIATEVREDCLKKGERVTDSLIENRVTLDPRYQQAYRNWTAAVEGADKLESAKFTIARKQAIMEALAPMLFPEEAARRGPRPPLGDLPWPWPRQGKRTPLPPRGGS